MINDLFLLKKNEMEMFPAKNGIKKNNLFSSAVFQLLVPLCVSIIVE